MWLGHTGMEGTQQRAWVTSVARAHQHGGCLGVPLAVTPMAGHLGLPLAAAHHGSSVSLEA